MCGSKLPFLKNLFILYTNHALKDNKETLAKGLEIKLFKSFFNKEKCTRFLDGVYHRE
jgi:hypothetical protein